jgi:two-component system chemotaxis response regulator CheB
LIVDDSVVFRSAIKTALEGAAGIEVTGVANNGKIAIQKLTQSTVDLITLDMEMPEMGGVETIREIKKLGFKTRIIVFSAHTTSGSEAALDALIAGADDFIAKPNGGEGGIQSATDRIRNELLPKIMQFAAKSQSKPGMAANTLSSKAAIPNRSYAPRDVYTFRPGVIVIGTSTGGPPALERVLLNLPNPCRLPILIVQHMPPVFTASLAKRLKDITGIEAAEGKEGEELLPNRIYVAPGDYHMSVAKRGNQLQIALDKSPPRNSVRPSVDVLFETVTEHFAGRTMAFVLTGMGEDGLIGGRAIKEKGGGLMIQDRASCVVFGMPGAIFAEGFQDSVGSLVEINEVIKKMTI